MRKLRALILTLILLFLPFSCDTAGAKSLLKVAFLDIGQGDAIYIEAPNGNQMIIDGGPLGSLETPLSAVMPFGDRSVNVLMVTNPDADHYAGFIDVMKHYEVGAVIESGTTTHTPTHAEFQSMIADQHIPEVLARRGMTIDLDKEAGVQFTVCIVSRS